MPVVVGDGHEARAEHPSAAADRRPPGRRWPTMELDVTTDR